MGRHLWIDDVREMPEGFDLWAKDSYSAVELLRTGSITFVSFDHDLGGMDTGYTVSLWLEKLAFEGTKPPAWAVHSANPVGRDRINASMRRAHELYEETLEINQLNNAQRAWTGKHISVDVEQWNGDRNFEIVNHPGAVAIVATNSGSDIALVRQYRPAIRDYLLELPAGTIEEGEDPLDTAKRELREETGLVSETWTGPLVFWTSPGYTREQIYMYFAHRVKQEEANPQDGERIEVVWMSPQDYLSGTFLDALCAKTLVGINFWLGHIGL